MSQQEAQYLTQDKFDELKKELDFLKSKKRREIADTLEYTKKLGDLSENAEYNDAREEQAKVEDRINHIEKLLQSASILSDKDNGCVSVGSKVSLLKDDGKETKYTIVGSEEADMDMGKISNLSPLGEVLIGKKVGEKIELICPKGKVSYKILDIH